MDIGNLATTAVSLLVPYLAEAGKSVANKVGEDAWNLLNRKIETLYELIKNKFHIDDYASETLERLEEKPEDEDRQKAMEIVLKEVLKEDKLFKKMLSKLVIEMKQEGSDNVIQADISGAAATHGGVALQDSIFIGGDAHFDIPTLDDENETEFTKELIIPFEISKEEFETEIKNWLIEGWRVPDDILNKSKFDRIQGLYIPFYLFKRCYSVKWNGVCVSYENEEYTDVNIITGQEVKKTRQKKIENRENGIITPTICRLAVATNLSNSLNFKTPNLFPFSKKVYIDEIKINNFCKKLKKFDYKYIIGFSLGNFKDLSSLIIKLRESKDPLSQYIRNQFSENTNILINEYVDSNLFFEKVKTSLIEELNQLLKNNHLYDKQRFSNVKLSDEIMRFMKNKPKGKDLIQLNRLLLEEAYPNEISNIRFDLFNFSFNQSEINTKLEKNNEKKILQLVKNIMPCDKKENVKYNKNIIENIEENIYFPFWFATYSYGDKKYQFALNGIDISKKDGTKPQDLKRVLKIFVLSISFLLFAFLTLFPYVNISIDFLNSIPKNIMFLFIIPACICLYAGYRLINNS